MSVFDHFRPEDEVTFRSVAESLSEGLMIADLEGRILYANPRAAEMSGYEVGELEGRETFILAPTAREEAVLRQGLERRARGESATYETRLRRKDGTAFWIQVHASPYRAASGEVVGALAVISDIEERRAAHERLRLLESAVEQATDAILICTADASDPMGHKVVYVNPAFTRMTGYDPDDLLAKSPFMLGGPDVSPERAEHLYNELTSGRTVSGEIVAYDKDRSEFIMEWQVVPLRDDRGEVTHVVAVQRDVSEQRRMESQLRQSQKMEAVGRLAGGVAHDFNNLLTAIIGYNQLLLMGLGPDHPQREAVEQIGKAAARAAALTSQLLAFSRRQVLQPRVIDVNAVLTGIEQILGRLIGEDIDLDTRLSSEPAKVKADPGQLEQVILNLALNARDAMPEGGHLILETAHVDLAADEARELEAEPGAYVRMRVRDSGLGMDAETQAKIFEPFFTTKAQEEGTGLGLATVYGIVKQSGGYIGVESTSGQGTTFSVYLPAIGEAAEEKVDRSRSARVERGHERVLLAEDDDGVRSLVATVLTDNGYRVLEAADGQQAMALAAEASEPIDLLISDVVMPDMRGPELERRVLAGRPGMRTLFISGYADGSSPHRGEFGADVPFLQKPFSPDALARKVREVLDRPRPRAGPLIPER